MAHWGVRLREVSGAWELVETLDGHVLLGSVRIRPSTVDEAIRLLQDLRAAWQQEEGRV